MIRISYRMNVPDMREMTRERIEQGWHRFAIDLRTEAASQVLSGVKSGKTYRNVRLPGGRIKRRHVASAPGESHANLSGALRRAMGWTVSGWRRMDFGYGVGARHKGPIYARAIELGRPATEKYSEILPRPTLGNAITTRSPESPRLWHIRDR